MAIGRVFVEPTPESCPTCGREVGINLLRAPHHLLLMVMRTVLMATPTKFRTPENYERRRDEIDFAVGYGGGEVLW
jgi:hypothetical protein